jgi:hypothetical protein
MRIVEIASAEEQLALWKLISDNVWSTISQQARTEAQQKAAAAAKVALKPKKPKSLKSRKRVPRHPSQSLRISQHNHQSLSQRLSQPERRPRSSPLPTRQAPLPSSQPVLPPVRSTAFSQA